MFDIIFSLFYLMPQYFIPSTRIVLEEDECIMSEQIIHAHKEGTVFLG